MFDLDNEVNQLQSDLMLVMTQVSQLDARKSELEAKRQYALSQNTDDIDHQIENLKFVVQGALLEYNDRVSRYKEVSKEVQELSQKRQQVTQSVNSVRTEIEKVTQSIQIERMNKNQLVESIETSANWVLSKEIKSELKI